MKALLYTKPMRENAAIVERSYPVAGPNEVIIKVMSCSLCHGVEGDHDKPDGSGCCRYPLVPGHEFAGYVEEIGENVTTCRVGERVTADNVITCGTCFYCKKGDFIHCPDKRNLGNAGDGGFAQFIKVPERNIVKIPNHLTFDEACLCEPVACCMHSMDQMNIKYGEDVIVLGAGPMGNILAQLAAHSNANHVTVIAPSQNKLDILRDLGIDTIRMDRNDYSKHEAEVYRRYPLGVDCLFDATGAEELVYSVPKLMKMGGRILGYGYYRGEKPTLRFPFNEFWDKELTYLSSLSQVGDFQRAMDAIACGKVNTRVLKTAVYDLDHYFEAADRLNSDRNVIKLIIHPNGEET